MVFRWLKLLSIVCSFGSAIISVTLSCIIKKTPDMELISRNHSNCSGSSPIMHSRHIQCNPSMCSETLMGGQILYVNDDRESSRNDGSPILQR
ncbi:hypothetical protein GGR54DRAFT_471123 [Hypoxylon sp. NC1633]|nr:hypothetical protein GGR54DRAFT_471123 [Hypoxylon sp. NC1633]